MAGGPKLSHRKEAALAALLASKTVEEAAQTAGVGLRTLRTWLGEAEFAAAYASARRALLTGVIGDLIAASTQAVKTLVDNLDADKAADQNKAAGSILAYGMKGVDFLDLAARG